MNLNCFHPYDGKSNDIKNVNEIDRLLLGMQVATRNCHLVEEAKNYSESARYINVSVLNN
jgi:hypothetical protein